MEKNANPPPRYIVLSSIICSILTTVGTGISFKCSKWRAGLEKQSAKREVKKCVCNTCMTFSLWPCFSTRQVATYWSTFHVLFVVAQDKMKFCKLGTPNRQITEISPSLKANEHVYLASPKRPSSPLPPVYLWLMALPDEAWVCASCWWSVGKSPQQKVSS